MKFKTCECGHAEFTEFAMVETSQSGVVIAEDSEGIVTCDYDNAGNIEMHEGYEETGYRCDACDKEYPAEFGGHRSKRPVGIQIGLEGGLITGVSSDVPVEVLVLDFDVEGACDDEISLINGNKCLVRNFDADVDPEYIDNCFRQVQDRGAA
ncbi:MAG: hypothetical protein WC405_17860 [Syntrophales bacterium]|jgi:hypothetical protein|nr:hypothetical protein [Syntrophales bacterium]